MKKPHECADLAELHAQYEVQNVTKNNAHNHDAKYGVDEIMSEIQKDPNAPKQVKIVARVYKQIMNGSLESINMLDDTAQAALTALVDYQGADAGYTQAMRDDIESFAKTYPYKDWDQAMFDAEKAKQVSMDNAVSNQLVNENPLVKGSRRELLHQIDVTFAAIAYDDVVTVYAESKNNGDATYSRTPTPVGTLAIAANESGTLQITINKQLLKNQIRYYISSKHSRTLTANAYLNG